MKIRLNSHLTLLVNSPYIINRGHTAEVMLPIFACSRASPVV